MSHHMTYVYVISIILFKSSCLQTSSLDLWMIKSLKTRKIKNIGTKEGLKTN